MISPSRTGANARKLTFTFDGTYYSGLQGDTLASALIANDMFSPNESIYKNPE